MQLFVARFLIMAFMCAVMEDLVLFLRDRRLVSTTSLLKTLACYLGL